MVGILQKELLAYLAEIKDVKCAAETRWCGGGATYKLGLPHWSSAAYNLNLALVQPSGAAAEQVFSILRSHFDDHQAGALEDYLEAAVMLAYNYRGWLTVHLSDSADGHTCTGVRATSPPPSATIALKFCKPTHMHIQTYAHMCYKTTLIQTHFNPCNHMPWHKLLPAFHCTVCRGHDHIPLASS